MWMAITSFFFLMPSVLAVVWGVQSTRELESWTE